MNDETTLQAPDSETALIGIAGHHPDAITTVLQTLNGDAFYDPARGTVWNTIRALHTERELITPVTVSRHLVTTGNWNTATQRVIQHDMTRAHPAHTAERHAELIADLNARRALARAIKRAENLTYTHPGDTSEALAAVRATIDELDTTTPDNHRGSRSWLQMLDEFEEAHAPGGPTGIPTPWHELDELIGGLFPGRMYVIGGAPGDGKSTGALNIALDAAHHNHPTLVFSKEMPVVDVFGRLIARGAEVDLRTINRRALDDLQRRRIRDYARKAGPIPLWVNADPGNLTTLKTTARAHRHRHGLDVLVVDYLQLVDSGAPTRTQEEEVARVSTALKQLAMELECAVVVPAQLNRAPATRTDGRPTKSDLRSSGRIEQDADVVALLWHQKINGTRTGNITIIVDKNRHGPTGDIELRWHGAYGAIG